MKDAQGVRYAWRSCQEALYSRISEWGNLIWQIHIIYNEGNLENWNISCTKGKEINWDSHSSDERTGNSLNHIRVRMRPLRIWGCKSMLLFLIDRQAVILIRGTTWEGWPERVKASYSKIKITTWWAWIQSSIFLTRISSFSISGLWIK